MAQLIAEKTSCLEICGSWDWSNFTAGIVTVFLIVWLKSVLLILLLFD
jgi:hypothetical protein